MNGWKPSGSAAFLAVLVAATALAGCASEGAGEDAANAGNVVVLEGEDGSVTLAEGEGALIGKVQDDAGTPIGDATVALLGSNISGAKTDALGKFRLLNVSAGTYTLRSDHPGYRPTEEPVTVEAGKVTNIIVFMLPLHDVGPGYRPHLHDYWGELTEVVVIDNTFTWHEPYDDAGPYSETYRQAYDTVSQEVAHPCVWTDSHDEVYFNNRQIWFDVPEQLVWAGTSEIQVTLRWDQQDYVGEELLLAWRPATSDKYVEGEYFAKGETYTIPVGIREADSSHQSFTLWEFFVCVGKSSEEHPRTFVGDVDVEMKLIRGHPILPEPSHPRFWVNGTTVPVVDAEEKTTSNSYYLSRTPLDDGFFHVGASEGRIVPPGTKELHARIEWGYDAPVVNDAFSLSYRPANVNRFQWKDPADLIVPEPTESGTNYRTYVIPVDPEQTDAFYQIRSNWAFLLNMEGEEDDWKWVNPCGACEVTVLIDIQAVKDPDFV